MIYGSDDQAPYDRKRSSGSYIHPLKQILPRV